MSLTFLYSLLLIMYVFFNQHLTSSMALDKENNEGHNLTAANRSQPQSFTKWVLGKDNNYHECPTNESLVDAEDILTFIDYIYDRQAYKNKIMSNYTKHAQRVARSHLKDINKIEDLIYNPSEHLNYTLEELAALRNTTMDPVIEQIQNKISEKPQLENEFKMKIMDLHISIQTLKEYKLVCTRNCKRKLKYHVEKRIKYGQSFCVNLNDLYENIDSKLAVVAENIKEIAHSLINKIDKKLAKKENSLRRKLEKGFLGKSGKTILKVLKLQNEHEKLSHDLVEIGNGSVSLEKFGGEVHNKSIEFRRQIEDYGEYCLICDLDILTQDAIETTLPGDYIISDSIRVKYEHVWNAVQTHVKSLYLDLFAKLKSMKKIKSIKKQYRLTKDEEAELKYDAEMVLDHLEIIGPQPPTRRVIELVKKSKELLQKLEVKLVKASKL